MPVGAPLRLALKDSYNGKWVDHRQLTVVRPSRQGLHEFVKARDSDQVGRGPWSLPASVNTAWEPTTLPV